MSVFMLIESGGAIMIPLLVCSLVVVIVAVERALAFKGWEQENQEFVLSYSNLCLKGDWQQAAKLSEKKTADTATLALLLGQERATFGNIQGRCFGAMDRKRQEINLQLRRFLWILGTVGSLAPFIGLFGTVVGIIESFHNMSQQGSGGFAVVAGGISQALVATAGGIVVAILAVFLYNFFQVKVAALQFRLKNYSEELKELASQATEAAENTGSYRGDPS